MPASPAVPRGKDAIPVMLGTGQTLSGSRLGFGLNETASRALPGMSRLSLAIIALSFALLIGAFVLTVFTF